MSHTKEPWAIFEDDAKAIVTANHPMLSLMTVDDDGLATMFSEADARRIVTCVNACAGIGTEALEKGGIGSLLSLGLEEQRRGDIAEKQRDELLAFVERVSRQKVEPYFAKEASYVIASVKGGAA